MIKPENTPKTMVDEDNLVREGDNVVEFKKPVLVSVGGKEPPSKGSNWLDDLPVGTMFIVRKKNVDPRDFILMKFMIIGRTDKTTFLIAPPDPQQIPILPNRFCNVFDFHDDLGILYNPEQEQEKEPSNDGSDRVQGDGGIPSKEVE